MIFMTLGFLTGDLFLQNFQALPGDGVIWVCFLILITGFIFKNLLLNKMKMNRVFSYTVIFLSTSLLGFIWSYGAAKQRLIWELPKEIEGKTVLIKGHIASIPAVDKYQAGFLFMLNELDNKPVKRIVKLSWRYPSAKLKVGDEWGLSVRLKRIHGLMNPGGFDYEAWAFEEGIRAHGYVLKGAQNNLIQHHFYRYPLGRIRQHLKEKIEKNITVSETSPWIVALAVGERQNIARSSWDVLRNTGTNHLMAIAGLHIGFMSGFIFTLVAWLWRQFPRLTLRFPAVHAGAVAALIMALIYSALAGFSIPTQRACIMLALFLIVVLLRRKAISWQAWSIALMLVMLMNPFSVLSDSLWLSFGSVALIIYGVSGRINPKGLWWKWGRIQWVVAIGLLPLSVWLFQQFSLVSFIANSIAIPWVGFIIVPLTLAGCFCCLFSVKVGAWFLVFADKNLSVLWKVLTYLSHLSWAAWYQTVPQHWMIVCACAGIIILLLPRGFPGRWYGIIFILPLVSYRAPAPEVGQAWFTLLDVGQGLSAVVETQHHVLVFDAGPRLSENYDMGSNVVVPFLRTLSIKNVDMLVISHGDNDHIGGADSIMRSFPVRVVKTSVPESFKSGVADYCLRQESWVWDKVIFQFLYPSPDQLGFDNDSSCVLKVSSGNKSILLTGDIEKSAEKYLVQYEKNNLHADILVAPHHGSKTSADANFISLVNPTYVLFPVGYRNRYHFPNKQVVERYRKLGIAMYGSVEGGAIQFILSPDKALSLPSQYRLLRIRYWNESIKI
jgi:competence protein ComEC